MLTQEEIVKIFKDREVMLEGCEKSAPSGRGSECSTH